MNSRRQAELARLEEVNARSQTQLMNQVNENLAFITSLAPDMRRETLLTCPSDFLLQLPEAIQQEAQQLRDEHLEQEYLQAINANRDHQLHAFQTKIKNYQERNALAAIARFRENEAQFTLVAAREVLDGLMQLAPSAERVSVFAASTFDTKTQDLFYRELLPKLTQAQLPPKHRFELLRLFRALVKSNFHSFASQDLFGQLFTLAGQATEASFQQQLLWAVCEVLVSLVSIKSGVASLEMALPDALFRQLLGRV